MAKPRALRLMFAYENGVVHLVSRQEVDMTLPPEDAPAQGPEQGFWAELRDTSGKALFRRVMHNPIPVDTEVFSDTPERNMARVDGAPTEGMFSIVVPNDPCAAELALFSSHHEAAVAPPVHPRGLSHKGPFAAVRGLAGRLDAAREIAKFDLTTA